MAITAAMWLLRGLCGNYSGYVAVTGYMWQLQWLLRGLCGNYSGYVAVTGSMYNYSGYVAVTGSMWQLQWLCGCYRVNVAVTGSMWQLQGLCGCYIFGTLYRVKSECKSYERLDIDLRVVHNHS